MKFDSFSKEKLSNIPRDIDIAIPVDHSSVLFTSKLVEELGVNDFSNRFVNVGNGEVLQYTQGSGA